MIEFTVETPPEDGRINEYFKVRVIPAKGRRRAIAQTYASERYKKFFDRVTLEAKRAAVTHGCIDDTGVGVGIQIYTTRKTGNSDNAVRIPGFDLGFLDIDSCLKATLDGLADGGLMDNDMRVISLNVTKHYDPKRPRLVIRVWRVDTDTLKWYEG